MANAALSLKNAMFVLKWVQRPRPANPEENARMAHLPEKAQ
jgi:hypothetical protein